MLLPGSIRIEMTTNSIKILPKNVRANSPKANARSSLVSNLLSSSCSLSYLFYVILIVLTISHHLIASVDAIQSNSSCAALPKDKRQLVCTCGKQLQLRCTFNLDIREINPRDLDKTLKPIFYKDVSINRAENPDDPDDINANFKSKKPDSVYLYFPNFDVLDSPYIRVTFLRFYFVPSFAFHDKNTLSTSISALTTAKSVPMKVVPSLVFELQEIFDFGIDRYAFYNIQSDSLIIEGPFNEMTIHQDAFVNSKIEELTIGCYCLECETFQGDCRLKFNQRSVRDTFPLTRNFLATASSNTSTIKRIKLFGVEFDESSTWNLDQIPGINELTYLEVSNMFTRPPKLEEFKSNNKLDKLVELQLKNNGLKKLTKRMIGVFTNLKVLGLAQNSIERIDDNAFLNNLNLEELNLERNSLKKLSKAYLTTMDKLLILNLKSNIINEIDDNTFENLKSLRSLDLTRNQITVITDKTFNGLVSLRELMLSYNPLKKIDVNSFKFLALNSPINRLDLISNTETNWFVFEDADICMLAHFKCETQIQIDTDQRCNCFVKYMNEIALTKKSTNRLTSKTGEYDDNLSIFRACSDAPSNSEDAEGGKNGIYDDLLEKSEYRHIRDPSLYLASNKLPNDESSTNIICPKINLKRCYDESVQNNSYSSSCLYQKFFEPTTTLSLSTTPEKKPESSIRSFPGADDMTAEPVSESNQNTADNHLLQTNVEAAVNHHVHNHGIDLHNRVNENLINKNPNIDASAIESGQQPQQKLALESKLTYIVGGLAVIFAMSSLALILSIYLVVRRNTLTYHTAASYPKDER